MKRIASIDALVRWAYREQLPRVAAERGPIHGPKQPGNHMNGAAGALAATGDGRPNVYGLLPSLAERDLPVEPDALIIGDAVMALGALEIEAGEVDLIGDVPVVVAGSDACDAGAHCGAAASIVLRENEAGLARACRDLPDLMRRAAILGLDDGRFEGDLVVRPLRGTNGRSAWFRRETYVGPYDGLTYEREVDGYDARRKRPWPDAYRKWTCDGDAAGLATRRAEWQAWQAGLAALAEALGGALAEYDVQPFEPSFWPWRSEAPRGARVLPALGMEAGVAARVRNRAGNAAPAPRWPGRSVQTGGVWRVGDSVQKGA